MAQQQHPAQYDYDAILAAWETYPTIHIRYSAGEQGWAQQLSEDTACLANMAFNGDYALYDIVSLMRSPDGQTRIGKVLQRRYAQVALVRYPTGTNDTQLREHYGKLVAQVQQAGGACEGAVAGMAMVNLPQGCDVAAVVKGAGKIESQQTLT